MGESASCRLGVSETQIRFGLQAGWPLPSRCVMVMPRIATQLELSCQLADSLRAHPASVARLRPACVKFDNRIEDCDHATVRCGDSETPEAPSFWGIRSAHNSFCEAFTVSAGFPNPSRQDLHPGSFRWRNSITVDARDSSLSGVGPCDCLPNRRGELAGEHGASCRSPIERSRPPFLGRGAASPFGASRGLVLPRGSRLRNPERVRWPHRTAHPKWQKRRL